MKKLLLLLLLLCRTSWAAVSFDAVTTGAVANNTTLSWNHTVGSGCTNAVLIVDVTTQDDTFEQATSVKYNGVNLTSLSGSNQNNEYSFAMWYLKAPATGSALAVQVIFPLSKGQILTTARSYCGVNQTTTFGTAVSAVGSANPVTVNATAVVGDLVIDMGFTNNTVTATVVAPQTQRSNQLGTDHRNFTSEKVAATTTVAMSWTLSANHYWGLIAVALKPSTTSSVVPVLVSSQRRRRNQ